MRLWKQKIKKKDILVLSFLLLGCLPSVLSLFYFDFFMTDDGEWMVVRFSAFFESLKDGQFPVRFLGRLNHGFGYPVANFLYPGFMYIASPIHFFGFNFVQSIKIVFGASMFLSALFSFLWLNKIFGKFPSLIGAFFYLYTPYHLFDLYKRGSVGEILALSIVPFVLWQIEKMNFFWICFGTAFLIISHNTLALLFLPFIFIYALARKTNESIKKMVYKYAGILMFSLGLSAFFWMPAIFELQYTQFSNVQISDYNDYFSSFGLVGISSFAVLLFFMLLTLKTRSFQKLKPDVGMFFWLLAVFSIIFSMSISSFFWKFIPSSFIQFPFRLLSFVVVSISFLSSYTINNVYGKKKLIVAAVFIILLSFSVIPYLKPSLFFDRPDSFYSTNEDTTTVRQEYLPRWVKIKPEKRFEEKVEVLSGDVEIKNLVYNSKKIMFDVVGNANSEVRINTIYYPGWNADIDGKTARIDYSNDKGLMDIMLNSGKSRVELNFSETPLRLFADIISVISLIFLIICTKFSRIITKYKFMYKKLLS